MTYLVINAHESDAENVMNDIYANDMNSNQAKKLLHNKFPHVSYDFINEKEWSEEYFPFADEYEFCRFH